MVWIKYAPATKCCSFSLDFADALIKNGFGLIGVGGMGNILVRVGKL